VGFDNRDKLIQGTAYVMHEGEAILMDSNLWWKNRGIHCKTQIAKRPMSTKFGMIVYILDYAPYLNTHAEGERCSE